MSEARVKLKIKKTTNNLWQVIYEIMIHRTISIGILYLSYNEKVDQKE